MLTANDIGDGYIDYDTSRRTSYEAFHQDLTDKSRPARGDILLTKDGTLGRVAIHDGRDACINQSVALLRVDSASVTPHFLLACLRGGVYQDRMLFDAGGTTIKHIYITRLAKMPLGFPLRPEQQAITSFLNTETAKLDDLTNEAQHTIDLLKERRSALISAAVTGKIDLRGYHVHSQPIR